jgi:hypothetical protein
MPLTNKKTNFHFEITVPDRVRLTHINIDGTKIVGDELNNLGMLAENRIVKGDKFVLLAMDRIFFIVEAVGEPNTEVKVALKFQGKDVELDQSTFRIQNSGRGVLALENIQLP